jgi:putative intracellular protease/amidase
MTGISSETANDDSTRRMQDEGKLVVSVCHGPAGLLPAIRADGTWVFQGYRLTSFTNTEEAAVGLAEKVPFLLESRLRELGGIFQAGTPWMPHVVADRNLITGQNPASSGGVAQVALARLNAALRG